ncbi:hypothetical protein MFIFM68171_05048 [Madurella fahalii]|uniref:Calcineurin-like phosphoesterase domain-containing protein n=1 Tax=Madurella fahalii TaxID=1157608 RepID=A0ABQ0GAN5_9PEZI
MSVPPSISRPTRRTRIVCISDTHNSTVKLPKGDVLIHAGDLTNQGSYSELSRAVQWLEKAAFEAKIVIAGNHDITLDPEFYSKHGSSFHNQDPQDPARCSSLLSSSRTITYLQHGSATIRLTDPRGPGTEFTVFGSPYSPRFGTWAFMYDRPDQASESSVALATNHNAAELWAAIPLNVDILVTHTPAFAYCDDTLGCRDLRLALARVRPRLHVCGHVHQARGAERVRWNLHGSGIENDENPEASVESWEDPNPDPASAKISLVDLTARGGNRPLDFHDLAASAGAQAISGISGLLNTASQVSCIPSFQGLEPLDGVGVSGGLTEREDSVGSYISPSRASVLDNAVREPAVDPRITMRQEPMARLGRRETCVINCAIVATGWPHVGGKRFNKPIVVDLDLPVWG